MGSFCVRSRVLLSAVIFIEGVIVVVHGVLDVEYVVNILFLECGLGVELVSNWSCY